MRPTDNWPNDWAAYQGGRRAGMDALKEGQRVSFDILAAQRTGKSAADNLRAA
jgi:CspA family cold shock protein